MLEQMIRNAVADELRRAPAAPAAPTAQPSDIITADQLAALLGVNRKTVYECAARGEIPHARLGRRLVFSRAAVLSQVATPRGLRDV